MTSWTCAIDERKLFPNLDGVAAQMRRDYSPSGEVVDDGHDPSLRGPEGIGEAGGILRLGKVTP